jgi:DNA-binding MarR family transcriptional regulator
VSTVRKDLLDELAAAARVQVVLAVRLNQQAAAVAGLNAIDIQALNLLMLHGPMSASALAARLGITAGGGITAVADRLDQRGLIQRLRSQSDRRQVMLQVRRGPEVDAIGAAFAPALTALNSVLDVLADHEIETVTRYLTASNDALISALEQQPATVEGIEQRGTR